LFCVAGEAEYINDIPDLPDVLHAAFVLTTVAQGYVDRIDPSEALVCLCYNGNRFIH
jgi:xanthine dehydrogenase large subunit